MNGRHAYPIAQHARKKIISRAIMRAMTTNQAINYFGSITALARALHIRPQSIHQWGAYPPPLRQWQLASLSHGELKLSPATKKNLR